MLHNKVLYSYNDVMIEPAVLSEINSRSECNPFKDGMLPIFTAPMSTVVNEKNYGIFKKNGIIPIMPRNISVEKRYDIAIKGNWAAFSLKEFKELFCNKEKHIDHHDNPYKVLIDVANGHMKQIYDLVREAKELHGKDNIIIMVGNIANPKTYFECYKAGVDYVRVGIGGGCFVKGTQVNTSNGLKNIEDINVNDYVLTHNNQIKKCITKHEIDYEGKIININGIKCTPNHKFYVINKKDKDLITDDNYKKYAFWIEAENLTDQHLLIKL